MTAAIVPRVSGGEEEHGHLEESGAEANEFFFRSADEEIQNAVDMCPTQALTIRETGE